MKRATYVCDELINELPSTYVIDRRENLDISI